MGGEAEQGRLGSSRTRVIRAARVAIRGRAHDDLEGICRDDVASRRDRDADAVSDLRGQPLGDELHCANGEFTDREREDP